MVTLYGDNIGVMPVQVDTQVYVDMCTLPTTVVMCGYLQILTNILISIIIST